MACSAGAAQPSPPARSGAADFQQVNPLTPLPLPAATQLSPAKGPEQHPAMPENPRITSSQAGLAGPAEPTSGRDRPGMEIVQPTKLSGSCKQDNTAELAIPSKVVEITLTTAKQHAKLALQPLKIAIRFFWLFADCLAEDSPVEVNLKAEIQFLRPVQL